MNIFFLARLTEDSQGVLIVWESTRCPSVPTDMHLSTLSNILSSEDDSFCIIHITSIDVGGGGTNNCFWLQSNKNSIGPLVLWLPYTTQCCAKGDKRLCNCDQILSESSLGWGKVALGFGPGWIRTLVSKATDSSHKLVMGET